ncbi:MAG TPA: ASPIC/UnbV domain-containing protein, partial [Vicinamibacterales bacterium]|nr:ASPIC/UnbV domain-containing protein [Vicinamibacterales bacterium]
DGDVDLSVTDGYGPQGGHFVFRNELPEEATKRSLSVVVLDAKGHHTRFGAEVRLFDQSGKILGTRQVATGGGYNTQSAAPVHFGLSSLERVTVEVTFMSNDGRKKQSVKNVQPADYVGKRIVIRQAP